ncbi:MAG: hypothetical protein ACJ72L_14360 [Marmoricola sp.]
MRMLPGLVQRRADKLWQVDAIRAKYIAEMTFLVGKTERAGEIEELAKGMCYQEVLRQHLRYHPRYVTRQPVEGVEQLTTGRDVSRPVILSFMHHARYDGMWGSIARHGVKMKMLALPDLLDPNAAKFIRQHIAVARRGGEVISIAGGSEAIIAELGPGVVMGIGLDVPSRTPVTFMGRKVRGSSGTPRIAMKTDAIIHVVTSRRNDDGSSTVVIGPPLDPRDYATAEEMLDVMLDEHSAAMLAWPEAAESPAANWGHLDDED